MLKAIVQKAISFLPGSHRLNFFFQQHITKGVRLTNYYFEDRLFHAKKHIDSFDKFAACPLNTTLELGTGWYPVVPISLFLRGARQINTVDISPLTNKENLLTTIRFFIDYAENGKLQNYLEVDAQRLEVLKGLAKDNQNTRFEDIAGKLNIRFFVEDIRTLGLDEHSVHLIHSNNTFEHVYPEVLKGILSKFKKLAADGGVLCHFIDMSDHFAHFDKSINVYNFLQFSDRTWRWIDNSIQPQNRWRLSDFQNLYRDLSINISESDCRKGNIEELLSVGLADKYDTYDLKDLAISHCYLVSKM